MQHNSNTHDLMSFIGDTPAAGMRDFSNQSADMESFQETRDASALMTKQLWIGDCYIQSFTDVAIAEALDGMLAAEDGLKKGDILMGGGIEAAIGATADFERRRTGVEEPIGGRRVIDASQGIQIATVGGGADLGIAIHIGNAFCHGEPVHDGHAFTGYPAASNTETVWAVNHGFDAQEQPEFVVHFNAVFADFVFEAKAFLPGFEGFEDFVLELGHESTAQESQDIFCRKAQQGVFGELGIEGAEIILGTEHDIGGVFGLVNGPVIVHALEQVVEQGIHASGQGVQTSGPGQADELIGQSLRPRQIVELDKGVFELFKSDVTAGHLTCQPGVSVNRDLDVQWEP